MLNMKSAALAAALILSYQISFAAGVTLNSMCFIEPGENTEPQAFNPTKQEINEANSAMIKKYYTKVTDASMQRQFRIASLSKAFTTHWAIIGLGPDYRFTSKVIFAPGSQSNSCHIHLQGDFDPLMSRSVMNNVMKQINTVKEKADIHCKNVETVTFDENFRFFPEAMDHQINGEDRAAWAWSNPSRYQAITRTKTLLISYLDAIKGFKPSANNVNLSPRQKFEAYVKGLPTKTFSFQSIPLFRIIKEMNRYSHNYIANMIFDRLGGSDKYQEFIKDRLQFETTQVHLLNGSGYPINGEYNLADCASITYMLRDIDFVLSSGTYSRKFQMADFFPVGGPSEPFSTFKSLYNNGTFDKTILAKTGSADQAITFAGVLSTKDGNFYFASLTSPATYGQPYSTQSRSLIKDLMQIMAERQTLKRMNYDTPGLTPAYDGGVYLKEEKQAVVPPAPVVTPEVTPPVVAPVVTPIAAPQVQPPAAAPVSLLLKKG
jgi:D-alanyl-D-alanine carboxypeptidase